MTVFDIVVHRNVDNWIQLLTCIMYLVDQLKPCAQIYLQKNCMLQTFAITNTNFCSINYSRHASSYNVDVYQFSAKIG